MGKRLKTLAIGISVLAAYAAVAAATAPAAELHSASGSTWFRGSQSTENALTINGGTAKCSIAEVRTNESEGANPITTSTTSSIVVHPTYSGCKAFSQNLTVTTTGCNYVLAVTGATTGTFDIVCAAGKEIVLKANTALCTVKIADHTPASAKVDFTNQESKSSVLVTWTVEGITYTSSGGICGSSGTNGKLTGTTLLKGTDSTFITQTNIWVE